MGRPVELPSPRGAAAASETSSSGGEDEGWVVQHSDDDEGGSWADPSGGVLSQVFDAAEAGDAAAMTDLLQGLEVSIDTRVSWRAEATGGEWAADAAGVAF